VIGERKSPITSDPIVAQITMLSDVRLAGDDIYWLEGRPQEQLSSSPEGTEHDGDRGY
jgi:hypothetical protein